jgi:hypothetical protein
MSSQDTFFVDLPRWMPRVTLHQRGGSLDSSVCNRQIMRELKDSIEIHLKKQMTSGRWILFKGFSYGNVYNEYIYGIIDEKEKKIFRLKNLGTSNEHPLNHPRYDIFHNKVNKKKQNDNCIEVVDLKDGMLDVLDVFFNSYVPEIHIDKRIDASDTTEMFFCFEEKYKNNRYFSHGYIDKYFYEDYTILHKYDDLNKFIKKNLIGDFSQCNWTSIIDE